MSREPNVFPVEPAKTVPADHNPGVPDALSDPAPAPVVCNDALIDHEFRPTRKSEALGGAVSWHETTTPDVQLAGLVHIVLETSARLDAATLGQDAAVAGVNAFMRGAIRRIVGDEVWNVCEQVHSVIRG